MIYDSEIVLENERVLISPLEDNSFEKLIPICRSNPDLLKYSPSEFGTDEALKKYIDSALKLKKKMERYPFIIYDKKSEKYAGSTSYGNVSEYDKRLEIGWTWIGKEFQRTGLNRNCKLLLIDYAFNKMNFERVEFKIDSRNVSSRKAVEALGATFEGELRSHTLMQDGFRRNTVYYSILKNEWPLAKLS